jgi:hypothetical protein
MNIGFIWPVREEWGKKRFEDITSHYKYGYSIRRFPQKGDVLVFYHNWKLLGSIPVDNSARPVTSEDLKNNPYWVRNWKYVMGLDGARKLIFSTPVEVEEIANCVAKLKGKENLHAVCRNAPKITMSEYQLIVSAAEKITKKG